MTPDLSADSDPGALTESVPEIAVESVVVVREFEVEPDSTVPTDWASSGAAAERAIAPREELDSSSESAEVASWDASPAAEPLWDNAVPEALDLSPEVEEFRQRLAEAGIAFAETFAQVSLLEFLSRMGLDQTTEPGEEGWGDYEERPGLLASKDYLADWSPEHVHEALGAGAALLVAYHLFAGDEGTTESEPNLLSEEEPSSESPRLLYLEGVTLTANGEVQVQVRDPLTEGAEVQNRTLPELVVLLSQARGMMIVPPAA